MTIHKKIEEFLENNQRTWLVTGVAGFVGSNLLEKLLTLNQKVIGLDNFETGNKDNIDQAINDANNLVGNNISNNFRLIEGDISNLNDCRKACKNVEYVLHQAALGSIPKSIEDPFSTNNANINGFLNMLIASKDETVKRFVFASSSSVYGDDSNSLKIENIIGNPLNPYAVSKITNEMYANIFSNNYNLQVMGLRYFNVFGKRQNPNGAYAAVIPKWISTLINKEKVFIYGDGETTRDFCYIDNAVQINLLAAISNNSNAINQNYNVAVNERTSLNTLFKSIQKIIIQKLENLEPICPIYKDFRVGDIRHSLANINKAKNLLNYQPTHSFLDGIEETIDWYIKTISNKNLS